MNPTDTDADLEAAAGEFFTLATEEDLEAVFAIVTPEQADAIRAHRATTPTLNAEELEQRRTALFAEETDQ